MRCAPGLSFIYFGGWILIQENEEKGNFMGDDIGKEIGLSENEAALRLKTEGYNELPSSGCRRRRLSDSGRSAQRLCLRGV